MSGNVSASIANGGSVQNNRAPALYTRELLSCSIDDISFMVEETDI